MQLNHVVRSQYARILYNKSLHPTIEPVTPCADAQAAPAPLAGEANVTATWLFVQVMAEEKMCF